MVERSVRIGRERLHQRPVAGFVRLAQTFEADVQVWAPLRREGRSEWMDGRREGNAVEMNGKRYLTLSAVETLPPGAEMTLRATGPDAEEAVEALTAFLRHRVSIRCLQLLLDVRDFAQDLQVRVEGLPSYPVLEPEEREDLAADLERLEGVLEEAREALRAYG